MLTIESVSKSFGDNHVLNDISFRVEQGSVFGLTGINGSGKSTLLRIISDVYRADSGRITLDGYDAETEPVRFKERLFFLNDNPSFPRGWRADDVVRYYGSFYRHFSSADFYRYLDEFELDKKGKIHDFSKGMRRQLFLASALSSNVELILLDEAFDGLDPLSRLRCLNLIREKVSDFGTSFIISSHSLRELEDIADSFGIINSGVMTTGSKVEELHVYHKYQLVITRELSDEELSRFNIINMKRQGHVIELVIKGSTDEIEDGLKGLDLLLYEEIPVSFEDLFLLEVEKEKKA